MMSSYYYIYTSSNFDQNLLLFTIYYFIMLWCDGNSQHFL